MTPGSDAVDLGEDPPSSSESRDAFPAAEGGPLLLDPASMDIVARGGSSTGPPSVATTVASAVGSVVGTPRDAFLKSITIFKEHPLEAEWDIRLCDHVEQRRFGKRKAKIQVESISGSMALSKIHEGDFLSTINGKRCGPSLNAARALESMKKCYEEEGMLSVSVGNNEGDDILVQATIIKQKPTMTYAELGMEVWMWGFLCIKSIGKESIFRHTVLKSNDHIISINDILVEGLKPEQVAEIITSLPLEVTITVLRRKQRITGMFG